MDVHRLGLEPLLAALDSGTLSARAVVRAHLDRIDAVNTVLGAVVGRRDAEALAEAHRADARRAAGEETPPLLGVPCTIKEFLAVAGQPWTAGLVAREGVRATEDATVVQRLRAAGAVVLGVTNAPEGGLWAETDNRVYGPTVNPWDPTRTAGGSSGGEGAILAAGGSVFGIGSDIGGSIRIPAALCGIAGHKPTAGLVPVRGHHPTALDGKLCVGPMGRRVDDLWRVLQVIAGPDPDDPSSRDLPLGDPAGVDLSALVVDLPDQALVDSTGPVREGLLHAAAALEDRGVTVRRPSLPSLSRGFWLWAHGMLQAGYPTYREVLGDGRPIDLRRAFLDVVRGRARHTLPPLLMAAAERAAGDASLLDEAALEAETRELRATLHDRLGAGGVLLLPTWPRAAPKRNRYVFSFTDAGFCGISNILGLPATSVPTGFTPAGLPVALQVVGLPGQDHLTLATAAAIEATRPPFRPAPVPTL